MRFVSFFFSLAAVAAVIAEPVAPDFGAAPVASADESPAHPAVQEILRFEDGGNRFKRIHHIYEIVAALDASEIPVCISQFAGKLSSEGVREVTEILYSQWVEISPKPAIKHAAAAGIDDSDSYLFFTLLSLWANVSPGDAETYTLNNPLGGAREAIAEYIALEKVKSDPEGAVRYAGKLLENYPLYATLSHLARYIAEDDPLAAMEIARGLPAGNPRLEAVASVVQAWAGHDLQAAFAWTRKQEPGATKDAALGAATMVWAQADAAAAITHQNTLPPSPSRDQTIRDIAYLWAHSQPQEVLTWSENLLDPGMKDLVRLDAVIVWSNISPEACATYIAGDKYLHQERFLKPFAGSWVSQDADAALDWAASFPATADGEFGLRERGLNAILGKIAELDPARAALYHHLELSEDIRFQQTIDTVADVWVELDPPEAANWSVGLSGGMEIAASVLDQWATREPDTVLRWIAEQEASASRATLIAELVDRLVGKTPALAFEFASLSSGSPGFSREEVLAHSFRSFHELEPENALGALRAASGITEAEKGTLTAMITEEG